MADCEFMAMVLDSVLAVLDEVELLSLPVLFAGFAFMLLEPVGAALLVVVALVPPLLP